ncbi:hypothetical protein [Deinococcus marmoris]|uniref:hypothetical protein n=1 Tax=Deinococcus marmoris TaxID=249408 RepID=UPI00096ACA58|nr:hypothetical protein [Deinococcus marmoris]
MKNPRTIWISPPPSLSRKHVLSAFLSLRAAGHAPRLFVAGAGQGAALFRCAQSAHAGPASGDVPFAAAMFREGQ